MKHHLLLRILPLSLIGITSCALPPREAWRVIQREGLIPYIAVEIGKKPVPPYVVRSAHPARPQPLSAPTQRPTPSLAAVTPTQVVPRQPSPAQANNPNVRSASLPPRYFETSPVSTPAPSRSLDKPALQANTPPKPSPTPARTSPPVVAKNAVQTPSSQRQKVSIPTSSSAKTAEVKEEMRKPAPNLAAKPSTAVAPTVASSPKPDVKETPAIANAPKPTTPTEPKVSPMPSDSSAPPPPFVKAEENSVISTPYGAPVPGRPGLVSSPYAGQYQLVDVTGLAAGQEVKCPYSGKIFKVPAAQIQAINKAPNLSSPPAPADKKP